MPGYRLVAPIGEGGSGEVWKAVGPGGIPVAMKFIRVAENLDASAAVRRRRHANLRSLELIREVRHAHLLPVFGAWHRDGLLIFVMELADRTLLDRCNEAIRAGEPGIPPRELNEYMGQAALGIDFLNAPRHALIGRQGVGIQHRDIKPQNLLLVGDCVKVGDFGQAKLLEDTARNTGCLTADYAPPELFEGLMTSHSDQYSLAVSYCQLRAGRLPFTGNPLQIMMGHFQGTPDLSMLPAAERPAVARALSKSPSDRWPDCRSFVQAIAAPELAPESLTRDPSRTTAAGPASRRTSRPMMAALIGLLAFASLPLASSWMNASRNSDPARRREGAPAFEGPIAQVRRAEGSGLDTPTGRRQPIPPPPAAALSDDDRHAPATRSKDPSVRLAGDLRATDAATISELPPLPADVWAPGHVSVPADPGTATTVPAPAATPNPDAGRHPGKQIAATSPPSSIVPRRDNRQSIKDSAAAKDTRPEAVVQTPKTATIEILMPDAKAELVVKGEVGRGNPDEWYGPKRVVHSPPMDKGSDYLVGAVLPRCRRPTAHPHLPDPRRAREDL